MIKAFTLGLIVGAVFGTLFGLFVVVPILKMNTNTYNKLEKYISAQQNLLVFLLD